MIIMIIIASEEEERSFTREHVILMRERFYSAQINSILTRKILGVQKPPTESENVLFKKQFKGQDGPEI